MCYYTIPYMTNDFTELNDEQRQVVEATDGPVLVLAGAGSGKTKALTHRIAHLLQTNKARPQEILAVTFTNKAAGEMKERVSQLVNNTHQAPNTICTFHSLGVRILREERNLIPRSPSFTICDSNDSERLIRMAMDDLNIPKQQHSPAKLKHRISKAKNLGQTPNDIAQQSYGNDEILATVYARYEKLLAKNDAYDFDDLILKPIELLEKNIGARQKYHQRWRWLSVDEYQDTNPPQDRLLELLVGPEKNICVVGDDYQAIYSWRGANVDHILHFEKKYPDCTSIYLTRNYRSTPQILEAANQIIAENKQQKHKQLWTDKNRGEQIKIVQLPTSRHEATFVRQKIEEHTQNGGKKKDCVILYRTNAQSRTFEEEFLTHGVPYTIIGGYRFYDRKEIKDAIAFLQLWTNQNSILALQRITNAMWKGVGPKTLSKWDQQTNENTSLLQVISEQGTKLNQVNHFLNTYRQAKQQNFNTVSDLLHFLLKESGYLKTMKAQPDGEERLENLEELINVAAPFTDVDRFLEEVALLSDLDTMEEEQDRVTCMTLHGAKGLEYPIVFVAGCEEGLLPHGNSLDKSSDLEEERRLLYVGMTRAQKDLYLTFTRSRYQHGQYLSQTPSRFLRTIENVAQSIDQSYNHSSQEAGSDILNYLRQTSTDDDDPVTIEVEEGHFVQHNKFGRGVVIETKGSLVTCVFENHGLKTIDAAHLKNRETQ